MFRSRPDTMPINGADRIQFRVTSTTRRDLYRRGGDSPEGRYRLYQSHPFSD